MPDQFQWADVDADKGGEMAASESAYTRLFEALRQLQADIDDVPATSSHVVAIAQPFYAVLL